ncbi:hypothetical protein GLW20_11460 [Virgibacillus halodenitrificans]|nr:hypothetical protein [Virgibacillus halodenitrificans]
MIRVDWRLLIQGQLTWNWPFLFILVFITGGYVYYLSRYTNLKPFQKQPLFFYSAMLLLFLLIGSPITDYIKLSFSMHMLQMSGLFFVFPPLLLIGISTIVLSKIQKPKLTRFFAMGRSALYLFGILFFLYHVPLLLTFLLQFPLFHKTYLFILFLLAILMWIPFFNNQLSSNQKKKYAFMSGIMLMPACMLFIMSAFFQGGSGPLATQLTAHLCIPDADLLQLLPAFSFSASDQLAAGFSMLAVHKLAILTVKRRK